MGNSGVVRSKLALTMDPGSVALQSPHPLLKLMYILSLVINAVMIMRVHISLQNSDFTVLDICPETNWCAILVLFQVFEELP